MDILMGYFEALRRSGDFWVLLSFLGFAGLLLYFRVPARILALLDEGRAAIGRELEEARLLREEAATLLETRKQNLEGVEAEGSRMAREARAIAERQIENMKRLSDERMARREKSAEERMIQAERLARERVLREAGALGMIAARLLLEERMASDDFSRSLMDSSLDEAESALSS